MTETPKRRAVFLDRDGVLNGAIVRQGRPYPPSSIAEVEILPGVPSALRALQEAGFLLIGATNQPDVGRGVQSQRVVETINTVLLATLPLLEICVCYHDDSAQCSCRKPQPGLLLQAAQRYGIDLEASFMVGDRWRDVEAGHRAGCRTIFIDYHYEEPSPRVSPDLTALSLLEAVPWIVEQDGALKGGGR